jgi:hypothetical protein
MNDATAGVIIVASSLAAGIFVSASNGANSATYGWGTFFLCVGVFTLFYSVLKAAWGWRR